MRPDWAADARPRRVRSHDRVGPNSAAALDFSGPIASSSGNSRARPAARRDQRRRSPVRLRWSAATASASSSSTGRGASATSRSVAGAALAERALEGTLFALRVRSGGPRDGHSASSGQARRSAARGRGRPWRRGPQRRCAACGPRARPVRAGTRRTFASTGGTPVAKAKARPPPRCRARRPAARSGRRASRRAATRAPPAAGERAAVVAEPLHARSTSRGAAGERPAVGKRRASARSTEHPLGLGLLQHHLGDEERVRVAGPPPRQVAADRGVPGEQSSRVSANASRRRGGLAAGRAAPSSGARRAAAGAARRPRPRARARELLLRGRRPTLVDDARRSPRRLRAQLEVLGPEAQPRLAGELPVVR